MSQIKVFKKWLQILVLVWKVTSEYPDSCRKLFDRILEKLVSSKHLIEADADPAKSEYANFLQTVVKKNRSSFQDFQVDEVGLDEFFEIFWGHFLLFSNGWYIQIHPDTVSWSSCYWTGFYREQEHFVREPRGRNSYWSTHRSWSH